MAWAGERLLLVSLVPISSLSNGRSALHGQHGVHVISPHRQNDRTSLTGTFEA